MAKKMVKKKKIRLRKDSRELTRESFRKEVLDNRDI